MFLLNYLVFVCSVFTWILMRPFWIIGMFTAMIVIGFKEGYNDIKNSWRS